MVKARNGRWWLRGIGVLILGIPLSIGLPTAAQGFDGLVVDDTSVTATRAADTTKVDVKLINLSPRAITLSDVMITSGCVARVPSKLIEPQQSTVVSFELDGTCFGAPANSIVLDLDGPEGATPTIVVAPPPPSISDWAAAEEGLFWGGLFFAIVLLIGIARHQDVLKSINGTEEQERRRMQYAHVTDVVDKRMAGLRPGKLNWLPLPSPKYTWWSGSVANLEAGWSLKDSLISNLTLGTTALVALVSSTDAATALLGEEPKAAFRVMAVVGLFSAVLLAIANLTLKVAGPKLSGVTPFGLTASTALVVGAAALQTITVGVSAAALLASGNPMWSGMVNGMTLIVLVALMVYGCRALSDWIGSGAPTGVPAIEADVLASWDADSEWEKRRVEQRIMTAFGPWLTEDSSTHAPIGAESPMQSVGRGPDNPSASTLARPVEYVVRQRALL